jgi:hypothetical protein
MSATSKKRSLALTAVIVGFLGIGGMAAAQASSDDAPGDDRVASSVGSVTATPRPVPRPSGNVTPTPIAVTPLHIPSTDADSGFLTDADHPEGDDSIGRTGGANGHDDALSGDHGDEGVADADHNRGRDDTGSAAENAAAADSAAGNAADDNGSDDHGLDSADDDGGSLGGHGSDDR